MKYIFDTYGGFLLEGLTVVLVLGLLFVVKDKDGNSGVLKILGGVWSQGYEDILPDAGFSFYKEEAEKPFPSVVFEYSDNIYACEELALDLFLKVSGTEKQSLRIKILEITDSMGVIQTDCYDEQAGTICFPAEGIYKLKISVKDRSNKKYTCALNIPVNRRG